MPFKYICPISNMIDLISRERQKIFKCGFSDMCSRKDKGEFIECPIKERQILNGIIK